MPKPVLSDSLFNADDVATAVLAEANLQVANSNLGVSDISSHFTLQSGWQTNAENFLFFNGFVFWCGYYYHGGGTPSDPETFITIDTSDYIPASTYVFPTSSYQGDTGSRVLVNTAGDISIQNPTNLSNSTYYIAVNGFWNVNI